MSKKKAGLHKNNIHNKDYDFDLLINTIPVLEDFVFTNKFGTETIEFANPKAVKSLNTALLRAYYSVNFWEFPDENLCPPIPGRVDYIHHLKDLLNSSSIKENVNILDIGTGATCIYPILGIKVYDWNFVGSDIDSDSIKNAQSIIDKNDLTNQVELRLQGNKDNIFDGILKDSEKFSASICNPPFYSSQYDAISSNARKLKGLGIDTTARNFGGSQNELWYKGGEKAFLHNYLYQSSKIKNQCFWFSSLVSKKDNIQSMELSLKKLGATEIKIIPMHQGNKVTRIIAWTFLTKDEQEQWVSTS